jgi:tRNA(fMet)-specific endonuclease VapC
MRQIDPADIFLCSIVKAELYYGAYKSARPSANLALIEQLASDFQSLPFDDLDAESYGRIRADLARQGRMIGPNDLLIAAIALRRQMTFVTNNTKEFSRVNGLILDDWTAP